MLKSWSELTNQERAEIRAEYKRSDRGRPPTDAELARAWWHKIRVRKFLVFQVWRWQYYLTH